MPTSEPPLPTDDDVRGYFNRCSNWGRWGAEDGAGTVNLITPEKRLRALQAVRSGRAISLSYPWAKQAGPGNANPAMHYMRFTEHTSADFLGIFYHGFAHTHLDALCHVFHNGKMFNGRPAADVGPWGARSYGVEGWKEGITTRGVLVDIPRFRGTEFVTLDRPVRGWEIEAAAEAQGVTIEPGDALLVYSGRPKFFAANPDHAPGGHIAPGVHVDACPMLKDHDVALLVWDMMDASPSGYTVIEGLPVHCLAIVYMGLPLLDNALLEPLADACAAARQWDFLLSVNPLHVRGATGSPVNPVAIL